MSIDRGMDKEDGGVSIYYSAIKKNEIVPFAVAWIDLDTIIPSEVSQMEKNKISYEIAYM